MSEKWYDFEHLLKAFNCPVGPITTAFEYEDAVTKAIRQFWTDAEDDDGNFRPEYVEGVRKLLRDLSTFGGHEAPVWAAMASMESADSMMRLFYPLFQYAWD